ncbi:YggT family protein [Acetobacterium sp.]|uniref:YggT family protein n=1 Tax=Acetobacterium sp. TaxID=1872094 RepID=UPI002F40B16F
MTQNILIQAGDFLFQAITYLIIINVVFSWIRPNPNNVIVKTIYGLTEPILTPLRRFTVFGALDMSAFAAILLIQFMLFPFYKMVVSLIF